MHIGNPLFSAKDQLSKCQVPVKGQERAHHFRKLSKRKRPLSINTSDLAREIICFHFLPVSCMVPIELPIDVFTEFVCCLRIFCLPCWLLLFCQLRHGILLVSHVNVSFIMCLSTSSGGAGPPSIEARFGSFWHGHLTKFSTQLPHISVLPAEDFFHPYDAELSFQQNVRMCVHQI